MVSPQFSVTSSPLVFVTSAQRHSTRIVYSCMGWVLSLFGVITLISIRNPTESQLVQTNVLVGKLGIC
jgi:hypothetical protein